MACPGLLHELLSEYALSEPAKLFLIGNLHALKSETATVEVLRARAESAGVLGSAEDVLEGLNLGDMNKDTAREFALGVLRESMPTPMGRRTTDRIVDRLLAKLEDVDDPGAFDDALSLLGHLAALEGPPETVLREAARIASKRRLKVSSLDELKSLVDRLGKRGVPDDRIELDLGLARGISYYTGVIFDLVVSSPEGSRSLGGGGRYDGLVKDLGADHEVPALGFAYDLDLVVAASELGQLPEPQASVTR